MAISKNIIRVSIISYVFVLQVYTNLPVSARHESDSVADIRQSFKFFYCKFTKIF